MLRDVNPDSSQRYAMFESFVNSNGVNIWTTRTGEGYPVTLCNGRHRHSPNVNGTAGPL
jgi:hypothetical protein